MIAAALEPSTAGGYASRPMSVTDDIRAALSKSPLSGKEIASRIGVNPVNLSHFKSGRMNLSLDNLEKLAGVLGLQIVTKRTKKSDD